MKELDNEVPLRDIPFLGGRPLDARALLLGCLLVVGSFLLGFGAFLLGRDVLAEILADGGVSLGDLESGAVDVGRPIAMAIGTVSALFIPIASYFLLRGYARAQEAAEQVSEELGESRRRLAKVVSQAPVVLWAIDHRGIFTLSEGRGLDAVGLQSGEVVGRSLFEMYEAYPELLALVRRALSGESLDEVIEVDGIHYDNHYEPLRDESGRVTGVIGVATDVTEAHRTAGELEQSRARLDEVLAHAPVGVFACDRDGQTIAAAGRVLEPLGLRPLDEGPSAIAAGSPLFEAFEQARAGVAASYVVDHESTIFDCRLVPAEAGGVRGVAVDVTARAEAERDLQSALDAAQDSDRLKSRFLANVSHEIRAPLNLILGYIYLIEHHLGELGDTTQAEHLQGIHGASARLTDTIQRILDISKIESGSFELRPEVMHLASWITPAVDVIRPRAERRGLTLLCEIEASEARVRFDEHCFASALKNLLDNAVKFTEHGGILVKLRRDREGVLLLEVSDTGVGIAEEFLPRLFEPFTQQEAGDRRRFEGAGLGLALVRRYLEMNGARLSIESEVDKGTRMTVVMPREIEVDAEPESAPAATRPAESEGVGRRRVVVVDDDHPTRIYMSLLLRRYFDVVTAASADELDVALAQGPPHAILMDVMLGGTDSGLDLVRRLRSDPAYAKLMIVGASAHVSPEDREAALAAGCDLYMTKPVDNRRLLAALGAEAPAPS